LVGQARGSRTLLTWRGQGKLQLVGDDLARVNAFVGQAMRVEPEISNTMIRLVSGLPNSRLVGWEARLKTFDSLAGKTATAMKEDQVSAAEFLGHLKDSIRYTIETPAEDFGAASTIVVDRLVTEGFESLKFKNSFGAAGYQGVNTTWRDPSTGHSFEVQFHTPESFAAKTETHAIYEVVRRPNNDADLIEELQKQQHVVFDAVPEPPRARTISLPFGATIAAPSTMYVPDARSGQYVRKPLQGIGYVGLVAADGSTRQE
jgi:hypothetical protein